MQRTAAPRLHIGVSVNVPVCRTGAVASSRPRRCLYTAGFPAGNHLSSPAKPLRETCNLTFPKAASQNNRPKACCQSAAAAAATSRPLSTKGPWQCLLPACKIAAALICMPLLMDSIAHVSQQWCLVALAGVFLPLQSKSIQQSIKRWQRLTRAAAAVEAETEDQPSETDAEEPNDNTILETGAELGNVQTPASVWLPYATGQNGKVPHNHSALPSLAQVLHNGMYYSSVQSISCKSLVTMSACAFFARVCC